MIESHQRINRRRVTWCAAGLLGLCVAGVLVSRSVHQRRLQPETVTEESLAIAEYWTGADPVEIPHPFCHGERWGYLNNRGEVVIEPQFEIASDFYEGLAAVSQLVEGKRESGYIRGDGTWVFKMPEPYQAFAPFSDGRARFCEISGEKFGFVDAEGRIVVDPIFDDAADFSEGRAQVALGKWIRQRPGRTFEGRWGYIDRDGRRVVPVDLIYGHVFSDGLAAITRGNSPDDFLHHVYLFIDSEGRAVLDPDWRACILGASSMM